MLESHRLNSQHQPNCVYLLLKKIVMLENLSSEFTSVMVSGLFGIQFILSFVKVSLYRYTINLLILNLLGNVAITWRNCCDQLRSNTTRYNRKFGKANGLVFTKNDVTGPAEDAYTVIKQNFLSPGGWNESIVTRMILDLLLNCLINWSDLNHLVTAFTMLDRYRRWMLLNITL